MEQATHDPEPWEVPPDEAYWQALLQEGEYGEGLALPPPGTTDTDLNSPPLAPDAGSIFPPRGTPLVVHEPVPPPKPHTRAFSWAGVEPATDLPPAREAEPGAEAGGDPADDPCAPSPVAQPPVGEPGCWEVFAHYQADGEPVTLSVESYNRGGLLVRWKEVLGFVPASQLCDGLRYGDEQSRLEDLADRVGDMLTLRVIEVDSARNRLVFSERAARHIEDPDLTVLDELNPGDVRPGHITNLCTFGAFVDLGGIEGLIHISELSWGRVAHPADVLQSGQQVEVYVLNVDREQGRVGLSLKRLQPDPWVDVEARYGIGQVVEGTVTNVVNFGAFIRLEEGLEGLIHASELSSGTTPPLHALREGEQVLVRIHSIESARHRIGLTLESL